LSNKALMWTTTFQTPATSQPVTLQGFGMPGKRPGQTRSPVVIFFHGGLFNAGNIEEAFALATALTDQALTNQENQAIVVCVDYPLAPEVKFPATIEVAFAALQWVVDNARQIGAHSKRIFVAGEHAGGNLAAVVAMLFRDRAMTFNKQTNLAGQILINPMLDALQTSKSMGNAADSPCRRAWAEYIPTDSDCTHPYASPLHSCRLGGLAPATIMTTESHPLRDEAEAYAAKLLLAGVPVQVRRLGDSTHPLTSPLHPCFNNLTQLIRQVLLDKSTAG
jgi:acetyl esterase